MKSLFFGVLTAVALSLSVNAQANPVCVAKAIDKNGKPLAGAAKASFMKKCEKDAESAKTSCEARALSKDGKPLAGAAKNSSVKKCLADAGF